MDEDETRRLLDGLGATAERAATCAALARHLGGEALFVLVSDPSHPEKRIPAPGCDTLPSSRGWKDLLARCGEPGVACGDVAFPDASSQRRACAYAFAGVVFVLVGAAEADEAIRRQLGGAAGVIAAMLRAEAAVVVARGELEVERRNAERIAGLARALDRARADAERATQVKNEFLAMLGHELRNPLAPIVTGLQMLRIEGVTARALDVVERQVGHMLRLVDDLLDISRITTGKVELRREPVELAAVVTRALEIARPLLEQRQNRVTVDVPSRGLVVDGDPARLAQIFSNLLTNAAKYSEAGSPIELVARCEGERVRLAVVDHGIGLDAAYLERIFDQFVQVPQGLERSAGGLGIGLAIVKSLVEQHGGVVQAHSAGLGRGSTFTVELPVTRAQDAASPPEELRTLAAAGRPACEPARAARVLLVDDNADAAELLGELLVAHGHEVAVAHTGPEALAALAGFIPDVALLDIGLPVMDGYELARTLRERVPSVRLAALTGYGQVEDRARSRDAGFEAHLVKPVSVDLVTRTVDELLG